MQNFLTCLVPFHKYIYSLLLSFCKTAIKTVPCEHLKECAARAAQFYTKKIGEGRAQSTFFLLGGRSRKEETWLNE